MAPRTFTNPSPHHIPAKPTTQRRLALRSVALAAVLAAPTWAAEFTDACRLYGAVESPCDPRQKGATLWPNGDVYYQFAKSAHPNPVNRKTDEANPDDNERVLTAREKELIRQGMTFWNEMTSGLVDFKESTTHPDRVIILGRTDGCCSAPLGRENNRRANIGTEDQRTIQHELGHILGLDHHHKRPDRDRFVRVDQDLFCKGDPHPAIDVDVDPAPGTSSMRTMDSLRRGCNLAQEDGALVLRAAEAAGSNSCQAYNGLIEGWVRGNVSTCSDTDYGPYNVNSVMQYGTDPAYCIGTRCTMDGRTGVDVAVSHVNVEVGGRFYEKYIKETDGAQVLEMYAEDRSWNRFRPVPRRDPGPTAPLDMTLAATVTMVGSPALTREGTSTVWAIARGSDKRFYVRKWSQYAQTHGAGTFEPIAGTWTSDPAIASAGADALNVVGLGTDGNVWHAHRIGAAPWIVSEFLGRPIASKSVSAPALVWTDDRLSVLVVSDGALYERYYSRRINAWHASGWKKIASGFKGKPAAVSWGGTRIDTFLVGDDDQIHQVAYVNGSWVPPVPVGGRAKRGTSPAVASHGIDQLDVYVVGTDGQLWHKSWSPGASGWRSIGGLPTGSPAAVNTPNGWKHLAINWKYLSTNKVGLFHRVWFF